MRKTNQIMLLDIGNTNLKWAWLHAACPGKVTSIPHQGCDIEQLAARTWGSIQAPSQTYIANVADPDMEPKLSDWISLHWDHEPIFVRATAQACGVTNSYQEAGRLGVDRWLTLIALRSKFSGPVCVVDCGTAITIDVLGLGGKHLGGLILPGFGLMQHMLLEHTAIPFNGRVQLDGLLATDTESAIAGGGVNAVAALVERIQNRIGAELNEEMALVLTGSDAELLQKAILAQARIETDLVMQGLIVLINHEYE
ncbi:MAG: type III pantothenate kinase [Gammaproteobacteria bacterium]|nr:type III pantothenate kinase [Gammaproteobacteria bacterium]